MTKEVKLGDEELSDLPSGWDDDRLQNLMRKIFDGLIAAQSDPVLRSKLQVDDLVQQLIIKLLKRDTKKSIQSKEAGLHGQPRKHWESYIETSALKLFIEEIRKLKRKKYGSIKEVQSPSVEPGQTSFLSGQAGAATSIPSEVGKVEERVILNECIQRLPEELREVITMFYAGLKKTEIAEKFRTTTRIVAMRIRKAEAMITVMYSRETHATNT